MELDITVVEEVKKECYIVDIFCMPRKQNLVKKVAEKSKYTDLFTNLALL